MTMLLEVDISKSYPGFTSRVQFRTVQERCGIFGPSGSGKSTLIHQLCGLLTPDRGRIRLNGRTLYDSETKVNLTPERRRVGVVFQHGHLFPHLDVRGNLLYGYRRMERAGRRGKRVRMTIDPHRVFTMLHLDRLLDRRVGELSGGERQRVALGRTLLGGPELILLDEPLTGLDGMLKYRIIPQLQEVFRTFSIPTLFISHSLNEMRLMTEEVLVMEQGKIVEQRPTDELARQGFVSSRKGYSNHLELDEPRDCGDLVTYSWGGVELRLVKRGENRAGKFWLSSRDIVLFKKNPEATSARNMLACTVRKTYQTDWLVGVELDCQGNTLVAEIVPQSVEELGVRPGAELVAVMKASAFHRLY